MTFSKRFCIYAVGQVRGQFITKVTSRYFMRLFMFGKSIDVHFNRRTLFPYMINVAKEQCARSSWKREHGNSLLITLELYESNEGGTAAN